VENPDHSDFVKLRTMLIQSHMHDLKETTQDLHYENFRARAIAQISQNPKERSKLKRDSSSDTTQQDMLLQKEAEVKTKNHKMFYNL
jgi:septin 4